MLPEVLITELFNLAFVPSDIIIQQLCEELEIFGFTVVSIANNDLSITINLVNGDKLIELRVDRINKCFSMFAKCNDVVIFPASGDWELVIDYLRFVANQS